MAHATHRMSRELKTDILQGTLDLLILKSLEREAKHGYAIAQTILESSYDMLRVEEGSLYPALHRIQHKGWIKAEWGVSENNRRAKYYKLTARGRQQLQVETAKWEKLARAIARILKPAGEEANS